MNTGLLQRPPDPPVPESKVRTGRELVQATAPYAVESLEKSWWHVGSTFVLLGTALAGAGLAPGWPLRLCLSIVAAMLMVRAFITYHDYMHGTILARSRLAWLLFRAYAGLALTPPRSWKRATTIITAMSDRSPAPASVRFR